MRDEAFEAICEVCNIDWQAEITSDQRGRVNAALKQLRDIYGDVVTLPMMVHERASAWREVYDVPLTPQALVGNWGSILDAAAYKREASKEKAQADRKVTNAHAKKGCLTCGDDHIVSVGADANGYELTAPCPDCNTQANATYWAQRRKIEPLDPAKTREMMNG